MKKGSLWVLFVVVVFGLLFNIAACQKKEAPTEQPTVTESATPPAAPEAAPPAAATTGGAAAPA
ncbi:MAG TPA: peptide ABC transporter substrate-binding protein, partial [Desulfomonilia bacterium]|nr:peptide ABC transporter substrate-binding protein [Desulfomonilia bacterium]